MMLESYVCVLLISQTLKKEMEELKKTVKALTQTTVAGTVKKILDYGARPLPEFNKFEALDMLEALQNAARDQGDARAGFFHLTSQLDRN